ncbi:MAG: tetrathionate reductase family octaheme c-type cytochrome [Deltaproteobacteria bacterium]|nr:tetrathionate reductase family octaheme c-type cytochrome [Deltaproteobacteria bacterium]
MSPQSNWCRCTSCHAGYGWSDRNFDFSVAENVDCLVCHDTTGSYRKFPADCGHPAYVDKAFGGTKFPAADLGAVALKVGRSSLATCGSCHFYGGGGDGVKHGDLDSSLLRAEKKLDVHMAAKGGAFTCSTCHVTREHRISGRCYSQPAPGKKELALPADDGNRLACESCHSRSPHRRKDVLNHHTDKVACQTCHIPTYARGGVATKIWWDWSSAGRFDDAGKDLVRKDADGNVIYHSKKGDMGWARDAEPEYFWYNGSMDYFRARDRIPDGAELVAVNSLKGAYADPEARIYPFKIMRGVQPFDPVNRTLVIPYLAGKKGSGAYWGDYDWEKAVTSGMREAGLPFSGKLDFIRTDMYWPITHMVTVKEGALDCEACHSRDGRLRELKGFYLPGRDRALWLDRLGPAALLLTLAAIALHAGLRARRPKPVKGGQS